MPRRLSRQARHFWSVGSRRALQLRVFVVVEAPVVAADGAGSDEEAAGAPGLHTGYILDRLVEFVGKPRIPSSDLERLTFSSSAPLRSAPTTIVTSSAPLHFALSPAPLHSAPTRIFAPLRSAPLRSTRPQGNTFYTTFVF